jgi:uncharacterized circularly permuted ATP-grasp superfamily protein
MNESLEEIVGKLDSSIINRHRDDTRLFERLRGRQRELGILAGDRPFAPFLRHQFFRRELYDRIVKAAEILACAFDVLTDLALDAPDIMAELGLSEDEERYARLDPGYKGTCHSSRFDAFISGDEFKFLEYNAETPAGITDQKQIEMVLEMIPDVRDLLSRHRHWLPRPHVKLLDALLASYREFGGRNERPNIAIVDWEGVSTYTEFEVLREYFGSEGYRTAIADPSELEYDGQSLGIGEFKIDIFYKRVIIHELFERESADHPILRAYRDGNLCMANSFRAKIPHKKSGFAVLQDDRIQKYLNSEQIRAINDHLPWTRRVADTRAVYLGRTVELLEHVRREQENLILKPNDDYGGSGIVIGWECTEAEWEAAIENALTSQFVVQERAAVDKVHFPTYDETANIVELLIDFDPFLFRGKAEGGLVRLSSKSLVNVAAGGGQTAMAVLEDL